MRLTNSGENLFLTAPSAMLSSLCERSVRDLGKADWKPMEPRYTSGFLAKYARLAQGAERGAITNVF